MGGGVAGEICKRGVIQLDWDSTMYRGSPIPDGAFKALSTTFSWASESKFDGGESSTC